MFRGRRKNIEMSNGFSRAGLRPRAGQLLSFGAALAALRSQTSGQMQLARLAEHFLVVQFCLSFLNPEDHHVVLLRWHPFHSSIRKVSVWDALLCALDALKRAILACLAGFIENVNNVKRMGKTHRGQRGMN